MLMATGLRGSERPEKEVGRVRIWLQDPEISGSRRQGVRTDGSCYGCGSHIKRIQGIQGPGDLTVDTYGASVNKRAITTPQGSRSMIKTYAFGALIVLMALLLPSTSSSQEDPNQDPSVGCPGCADKTTFEGSASLNLFGMLLEFGPAQDLSVDFNDHEFVPSTSIEWEGWHEAMAWAPSKGTRLPTYGVVARVKTNTMTYDGESGECRKPDPADPCAETRGCKMSLGMQLYIAQPQGVFTNYWTVTDFFGETDQSVGTTNVYVNVAIGACDGTSQTVEIKRQSYLPLTTDVILRRKFHCVKCAGT